MKHTTTGHDRDLSVRETGCDVVPIVEEREREEKVTGRGVVAATGGNVLETPAVEGEGDDGN